MREEWQALRSAVLSSREEMLQIMEELWQHPQPGFREWYANDLLKKLYMDMGFELTEAGNITGFLFDINTGRPGPRICLLSELDALICKEHPASDPVTGAVHACGHHCQCAALVGVVKAISRPEFLKDLSGSIRIMVVPAEELVEAKEIMEMRRKGLIRYSGGKVEFMSRGYFDSVDLAILVHTGPGDEPRMDINVGCNGCVIKSIEYQGWAAHAGASAHRGINALYAAQVGLSAVNALRETFPDDDHIRTHPIITRGGDAVNAIPAVVRIESQVRAANIPALVNANHRINRAMAAGALALGAKITIHDLPGYMPMCSDQKLMALGERIKPELFGPEMIPSNPEKWDCGCTDMGDVSCIMPVIMPSCAGAHGRAHGSDYKITNPELAVINPALFQSVIAYELLKDDAAAARDIIQSYKPRFASAAEYLAFADQMARSLKCIEYNGENGASVNW